MSREFEDSSVYGDMMELPHHVSHSHCQMDIGNRAAQFAPFAALTGYDSAVKEESRLTERKHELDESEKEILDRKLQTLLQISEHPRVKITCFQPDERKAGGRYVTVAGTIKTMDLCGRQIVLREGMRVKVEDIVDIEEDPGKTGSDLQGKH